MPTILLFRAMSNFYGCLFSKINLAYPRTTARRSPQGRSHSCPASSPPSPMVTSSQHPNHPSVANLTALLRQIETTRSQVKCCLTCSCSSSQNYSGISILCSREICPIYGVISYLRFRILQAQRRKQRPTARNAPIYLLIPAASHFLRTVIYGCAKRIVQFVCGDPIQIPNYSALRYYAEVGVHDPPPTRNARRNHSSYY